MARMPKEVIDLLNDPKASKVLATYNETATLNVAPKGTLTAIDDEHLAFADIWGNKTNVNLLATQKAAIAVFKTTLPLIGYQVKGTFEDFQTSGTQFENFAKRVRDEIKVDIKSVGVIRVDEVYSLVPSNTSAKLA